MIKNLATITTTTTATATTTSRWPGLSSRIVGVVFDSAPVYMTATSFMKGILTAEKNKKIATTLATTIEIQYKILELLKCYRPEKFWNIMCSNNIIQSPQLYLYSYDDPMADAEEITK